MLSRRLRKYIAKRCYPLAKRIIPQGYSSYRFPGGRIYLDVSESSMMFERALWVYEPDKTDFLRHYLRPGMTFIDIGANKGDFSLISAKAVGRYGKVFSFEPEPENCKWIRKSIALNGYDNITLFETALSYHDGMASLYLGEKSGWHTLLPSMPGRGEGEIRVAMRTLDSILKDAGSPAVDVMKIDVEGAEESVLKGASHTLSVNRDVALIMDIHPELGVDPKRICSLLSGMGFSIFRINRPAEPVGKIEGGVKEILARRV